MPPADALRLPSIDALRAFDAAARLGSFERAADELAVTASAVAKRMTALEDQLGTTLLQRTGKALVLTAAGREYLPQVQAALALLAAVPLHRRPARRIKRLTLAAPPTFARQILVPHLPELAQRLPHVELEVVLSIPFLEVQPGGAQLEVRHGDAAAFGAGPLMPDVVVPLAAPSLLGARRTGHADDLAGLPLLRCPIDPWLPWFRAAGLDWPEPDRGPRLVDLGLVLEAACAGQGVALARPSLARRWLQSGQLRPVVDLRATPASSYFVRPDERRGAEAAALVDWLREVCRREAEAGVAALAR